MVMSGSLWRLGTQTHHLSLSTPKVPLAALPNTLSFKEKWPVSRKNAINFGKITLRFKGKCPMSGTKVCTGDFAPPEPEFWPEFGETNFGRPNFGPEFLGRIF